MSDHLSDAKIVSQGDSWGCMLCETTYPTREALDEHRKSHPDLIDGPWHVYASFSAPGFVRAYIDGELAYWEGDVTPDDED